MTFAPSHSDRLLALALAMACGLVVQLPHLLLGRAFENLDFTVHYNYAREFAASINAGDWWPRYAFRAQHGLGEPGLLYYAPLYYWATWLVSEVTGNVWAAMQLVEAASAAMLGWFAWALAAAYAPPRRSLIAVPLAVFAPMAVMLQLSFNGYPWACALGPLAWLAWALLRPEAQGRWLNPAAILALATTVFTHTVSGLMAVILLGAMGLAAVLQRRLRALRSAPMWSPVVTLGFGLALSAAYLLPAFGSQGLIDAGVWRENYTPFNAFSLSTWSAMAHGIRWFAFQWPVSLIAFALSFAPLWLLRARLTSPAGRNFLVAACTIAGVVLFLATELSYPLWLIDTPLRNIQFPHRLISLLVPLAAVLATIALTRGQGRVWRGLIALGALASVAMGALVIAKASLSDGKVIDTSERQFAAYNGLDEYRTAANAQVPERGHDFDLTAECAARAMRCPPGIRSGRGMEWQIETPVATSLRLPVYCFPAWAVTVNGQPAPGRCDARAALVETDLPAGKATVSLQWQALPLERAGLWVSLVAALGLLVAIGLSRRRPAAPRH